MISCSCFHKTGECCEGGGAAVGEAVTGGTANLLLYVDSTGELAQNAAFAVDPTDGQLVLTVGSAAKPALIFSDDTTGVYRPAANQLGWAISGVETMRLGAIGPDVDAIFAVGRALIDSRTTDVAFFSHRDFSLTTNYGLKTSGTETVVNNGNLVRFAIGGTSQWGVDGAGAFTDLGNGRYISMAERADPASPAANNARLYVKDNGSGKTQLVVLFPTGAVQVIATEP